METKLPQGGAVCPPRALGLAPPFVRHGPRGLLQHKHTAGCDTLGGDTVGTLCLEAGQARQYLGR